jgi:2-oxoglutarate/2-oxoacid ferredoxin oxidoreductase subunit beta
MTSIRKLAVHHPSLRKNALGLTYRDYEGSMSTLCAGCGHDAVTAALVRAFYELDIAPHRVAKLSGIGCSSKTPTYFLRGAHGFNGAHGRMPALATGANAANKDLLYVGISGDGDSLSIGLGHLCHAIRRNVQMLYVIENNGVYGLTKGQFSASSDLGSKSKRGEPNPMRPIDPAMVALTLGASFVARSFSGDKEQLIPILKAGLKHKGLALIDVISPCVTFNDHEGSTKSYVEVRKRSRPLVTTDFVPHADPIEASYAPGEAIDITLHDGTRVRLHKTARDYDPRDRAGVFAYLAKEQAAGLVPTGILYIDPEQADMHAMAKTVDTPLVDVPFESLCPGSATLSEIMDEYR